MSAFSVFVLQNGIYFMVYELIRGLLIRGLCLHKEEVKDDEMEEEGMAGRREERIPDATLLRRSEASGNQRWEDQGGRLEGGHILHLTTIVFLIKRTTSGTQETVLFVLWNA